MGPFRVLYESLIVSKEPQKTRCESKIMVEPIYNFYSSVPHRRFILKRVHNGSAKLFKTKSKFLWGGAYILFF